jgi:hypothetical protein
VIRRLRIVLLATLLASGLFIATTEWHASAAKRETAHLITDAHDRAANRIEPTYGARVSDRAAPGPPIQPYVRPEFALEMRSLRPTIVEAARRHNHAEFSGMSDREFAVLIAALMYNEHFGWFEERVTPVQALTPFYESLQRQTNEAGLSNLSIWPANIHRSRWKSCAINCPCPAAQRRSQCR